MNQAERIHIEQACKDLVNRLCQLSDRHAKVESSELFTEGGTWIRGGTPHSGREAIIASFKGSSTEVIRHLATGTVIDVEDTQHARGVTYYIVYRHDPKTSEPELPLPLGSPFSMGEWHDRFENTEAGWRFCRREVKRLFQA